MQNVKMWGWVGIVAAFGVAWFGILYVLTKSAPMEVPREDDTTQPIDVGDDLPIPIEEGDLVDPADDVDTTEPTEPIDVLEDPVDPVVEDVVDTFVIPEGTNPSEVIGSLATVSAIYKVHYVYSWGSVIQTWNKGVGELLEEVTFRE